MINQKVLDIANNNKFNNLKNIYTHKAEMKNNICGDKIKIELVVKKNRINGRSSKKMFAKGHEFIFTAEQK